MLRDDQYYVLQPFHHGITMKQLEDFSCFAFLGQGFYIQLSTRNLK